MKAMRLKAPAPIDASPLELVEMDVPEPKEKEVRVKVLTCAVCRTDLHVAEGDLPVHREHVVPGHQVVGVVNKLGAGASRFAVGDRVGIAWLRWTCGVCGFCKSGKENLCPNSKYTGYDEDGGYAEYATVREEFAYAMPGELDPVSVAPLLCAGIIGYRALRRAELGRGKRVGLYGFGSSASIGIQIARHLDCKVYVMTRDVKHQKLARELGAEWAGNANERPPELLDCAVLFAPVGELVLPALEALDRGGTAAIAGIHLTDIPSLNYEKHLFYEKELRSVTANTRQDGEETLKLGAEIPLKPETVTFRLAEANEALRQLKHDGFAGTAVIVL